MEKIRLDRFISNQTNTPRSEVKKLIYWSKVRLNGKSVHKCETKINPETDIVEIKGVPVEYKKYVYYVVNKPQGIICSTKDGKSQTVISLLPPELRRKDIFPAGRLDKDTTGMVFITNDGELAHKILSPKNHIPKYYFVKLAQPYDESYENQFLEGIVLDDDEKCLPAKIKSIPNHAECAVVELHEGKFHQIKRMFESVGNSVEKLSRLQMGNLAMPEELGFGEYVEILHNDVENLLKPPSFEEVCWKINTGFWAYLINNNL